MSPLFKLVECALWVVASAMLFIANIYSLVGAVRGFLAK